MGETGGLDSRVRGHGGVQVKGGTMLLRQIHPSWIQDGVATSLAFKPASKDKGVLSTYDGSKITPAASWSHYTSTLKLQSSGVLGVSADECDGCGLVVVPDGKPYAEHVGIDFNAHGSSRQEKIAKKLRGYASIRGWLFQPDGQGPG